MSAEVWKMSPGVRTGLSNLVLNISDALASAHFYECLTTPLKRCGAFRAKVKDILKTNHMRRLVRKVKIDSCIKSCASLTAVCPKWQLQKLFVSINKQNSKQSLLSALRRTTIMEEIWYVGKKFSSLQYQQPPVRNMVAISNCFLDLSRTKLLTAIVFRL